MPSGFVFHPDRFLAQPVLGNIFACFRVSGTQENCTVTVRQDIGPEFVIPIFQLVNGLEHNHTGNLIFTHGSKLLREVRDFPDVRKLIQQALDMDREPLASLFD